jgi:hypothetical protein
MNCWLHIEQQRRPNNGLTTLTLGIHHNLARLQHMHVPNILVSLKRGRRAQQATVKHRGLQAKTL